MADEEFLADEMPLGRPAYYEAWGGLASANKALWAGLWFAVTLVFALIVYVRVLMSRPPVVIALDGGGRAQVVTGVDLQPPVGEPEVHNFLALFEHFFLELNVYDYDSQLRLAYTMMAPEFRPKADDLLKRGGVIDALKANQTKTSLFLTELRIVRDTPEVYECKIKGYRQLNSFKPDAPASEIVFEHDIVLRKVPRSEQTPYGLLVEDFRESLFKKQ